MCLLEVFKSVLRQRGEPDALQVVGLPKSDAKVGGVACLGGAVTLRHASRKSFEPDPGVGRSFRPACSFDSVGATRETRPLVQSVHAAVISG